jgi:uncharacterized repeat protein (TIGR03806 family)
MKTNEQARPRGSVLLGFALLLSVPVACGSDGGDGGNPGGSGSNTAGSPATGGSTVGGAAGSMSAGSTTGGAAAGTMAGGSAGAAGSSGSGGGSSGGCVVSKTDPEQPMLLSQTGCVDMADPTKPAKGLIPYAVRSPLWSDSATKERFVRIPDGSKIHVLDCATEVDKCKAPGEGGVGSDDGHWDMPIGTVLVKNFSIENKHVETRLLMRRSMLVWKGFSYEWNDAGTDATLLPDEGPGKDKPVGTATQVWHYPSRAQCLECHTTYTGRSLGLTTAQLNADFPYAEGAMNQVEKFKQLGLFEAPPKDIAGYPAPENATDGTAETRALSYLQTNCSICHRPGSEGGLIDFRFNTPFAMRGLCDVAEHDSTKVPKYRLVPGDTTKSGVSFRIHALDALRMPKIGSNVIDTAGAALVDAWITAMPTNACPPQPQ